MLKLLLIIFTIISNITLLLITEKNNNNTIANIILILTISSIVLLTNITITKYAFLYLINNILLLINSKTNDNYFKKLIYRFYILLCISIVVELTIFNYRSYTTFFYKNDNAFNYQIETNLKKIDNNTYEVTNDKPKIEIKNINKKVNNIYLDIDYKNSETYYVIPFFTDEGNKLYQQLESREVSEKINKSKILNFNIGDKTEKIKLEFTFNKGNIIQINEFIVNYKIPLELNIFRLALLFSVLMFIELFRFKSKLYRINYNTFKYKKLVIALLVLVIIGSFSFLSIGTLKKYNVDKSDINNRMAESLINGKTYFESDSNSEELLKTLDNPYDTNLREKVFKDNKQSYLWDCAYYKGHYYSYFGVVPQIMYYVPLLLLFNIHVQTPILVYVISMITAILLVLLLHQVVNNYFKKCSLGLFILLTLPLIYGSGILHCLKLPDQYTLPIICGLQFTYLGLNLIIWGINSNNKRIKLFFGALSLALVAGCRPQLLMGSFLLIPLLIIYLKNKPSKKEMIKDAISICIPYIVVAILLMFYNYIRFESVFDFGANYNLTTNDMTSRGFKFDRIPLGIVMYLFNPINFKNVFPYIIETEIHTNYLGTTIYEPICGGVFASVIITSLNLFIFKLKKYINSKFIFNTCLLLITSSLIIIIADTEMAGILSRYIIDFSWLLVFSSVLIILKINDNNRISKKVLIKIICILVFLTLTYQFFYYFVSIIDKFKNANLRFWLEYYYAIQFWL